MTLSTVFFFIKGLKLKESIPGVGLKGLIPNEQMLTAILTYFDCLSDITIQYNKDDYFAE